MKNRWKKMLMTTILVAATAANSMAAYAAPKVMADGNTFDADFYAATYPDVAAVYGNNEALLYQHYLLCGRNEGRLPYAQGSTDTTISNNVKTMADGGLFDAVFYARTYPDVAAIYGTNETLLYQHYLTCGIYEGRLPYAQGAVKAAPKNLVDCLVNEKRFVDFESDARDSYGNRYFDKYIEVTNYGYAYNEKPSFIVFSEVSGYQYLSGTLAPEVSMRSDATFKVNIYADNTLVYTSPLIEKYTAPINFDVAINHPSFLRIEVSASGGFCEYLIIANTILHN